MIRKVLISLPTLALMASLAHADPITVAGSYTTYIDTSGLLEITDVLSSSFSFPLTLNTPDVVSFITLTPDPGKGTADYTFILDADFTFTLPSAGLYDSDAGSGTLDVKTNKITSGALTWADGVNGTDITLSDGAVINVNLSDLTDFSGKAKSGDPQTISATFTLLSDPTAVPEPASLAIYGTALAGLGFLRRRRNKTA